MGYDAKTERLISLKKLAGKAQTSNDKGLSNEALPSGLTVSSETVFGQPISTSPSSAALYTVTDQVEYIRFECSFIAGSDTSDGRHGFELKLPSDYESNSSNSKAGTYPYINSQTINITSGALQLVPTSFATAYEGKPFYGGTSAKDSGTQIPILDARDWYLDYFNGVFFQQDPPGTGDHANNPDYLEAYLYVGQYLNSVIGSGGSGDPNAQYIVLAATGSLTAERVLTAGTGVALVDGGAGGSITLSVDNSVVATLTGSQFSGNVGVTGSLGATAVITSPAISGSLTHLADGTSYLIAGSNMTITTGSSGAVTISSTGGGGGSGDSAAEYLVLSATGSLSAERVFTAGTGISSTDAGAGGAFTVGIDNSVVATLTGSQFTGNVGVTGSFLVKTGDFIVESVGEDQALFLDASANTFYVNKGMSGFTTVIKNTNNEVFRAGAGGAIFNEYGNKFIDFRIESWNKPNAFFIDSNQDHVLILSGGGVTSPDESTYTDMNFFTSGSIGSRNSSTKGTSVFGGDLVVSGTITGLTGLSGSIDRSKKSYFLSSDYTARSTVSVASSDFSRANYDFDLIDILVNGQLVHSGTQAQIVAASRDYYVTSATSLKFSFDLKIDDIIDVVVYNVKS